MDISIINRANENNEILTKLDNIDPENFDSELTKSLQKVADAINEGNKNTDAKNKITPDNISGKVSFELKIRTHVNYHSEYMPIYDLTINEETFDIYVNQPIKQFVSEKINNILGASQKAFEASLFIKPN